ncbi:MAG: uroporphyrinogen decarboxylase, partial [Acidobacteria bacterium]
DRVRAHAANAGGDGVPTIHFGVGTGSILGDLRDAGGDVIGADWRTPLDEAWQRIGAERAVQGNLDPTLLLGPLDRVFAATDDVLARAGGRPGHIFNLGHGILPTTPVEHVQALARYVHQKTRS